MQSVFLWREMPDFERLKPQPGNEAYRQAFYERWGNENCIVCGKARNAEYRPFRQRLSIKVARGGRERYFIEGRSIAVDDDSFLILNDSRTYGSQFETNVDIESFSIFFRPGLAEEVAGEIATPIDRALEQGDGRYRGAVEFLETLQAHDELVTPVLKYVHYGIRSGVDDGDWYEEQLQFLLERMIAHQRKLTTRMLTVPALKLSTQREIQRRISLAVDLVHACYERTIGLAEMANAACMSKFHFLRLFTNLYGVTPHAYLQRKRALVATRLLARGDLSAKQVAASVGYTSRSTMLRHLRRWNPAGKPERDSLSRVRC